ncbi:MAG: hypothetical protein IKW59_08780 [Clostridia bacterium]|nr:hypothetical protein [Clostridia bacterium]
MLINFNRTVAYRCPACGEFAYGNFSLFELSGRKGISVQCSCGHSSIEILPENKVTYSVRIQCLVCDEVHKFSLPFTSLAKKECCEFTCPNVIVGLVFIGKDEAVKKAVLENEAYVSEVVAACGLNHTGKNGVTMLKALDKIQDLSDREMLFCECGANIIDVEIHEDDIILECCVCGSTMVLTTDMIRNNNFAHLDKLVIPCKH